MSLMKIAPHAVGNILQKQGRHTQFLDPSFCGNSSSYYFCFLLRLTGQAGVRKDRVHFKLNLRHFDVCGPVGKQSDLHHFYIFNTSKKQNNYIQSYCLLLFPHSVWLLLPTWLKHKLEITHKSFMAALKSLSVMLPGTHLVSLMH